MSTRIVAVRHGETQWNLAARIQGQTDSPLTAAGEAQAFAIAARLAGEPIDVIVASDLGRAWRTAAIIASRTGNEVIADPRLRERSFGAGEGLTYQEIDVLYPDAFSRLRESDPDYVIPGGESRRQLYERVCAAFESIATVHAGRRIAVVCHGGVLASLYRHIHSIPVAAPHAIAIPNAAYNAVHREGTAWAVEAWADTAHLPAAEPFEEP